MARFVKNGRTEKLEVDLSSALVVQEESFAVDGKEPSLLPAGTLLRPGNHRAGEL